MAADLFQRAARLLAGSSDFRDALVQALSATLPELGDFGFFDAMAPDGQVVRVVRAHEDEETESLLRPTRWVRSERADVNLCALSSGEAALHPDIDDAWYRAVAANEDHLALLRRLAFRSMVTVPLRFRGELIGACTLFMGRSGRRHDARALELAEGLAALASPLVANAFLLEKVTLSEERLRMSLGAARVGAWEWRIDDGSVYWSPEYRDIYGLAQDEIPAFERGMSVVVAEDAPRVEAALRGALAAGGEFDTLHRIDHPTRGRRFVRATGRAVAAADGRPQRMVGIARDVTDEQNNARALEFLQETLSEELRAMRRLHQIRTRAIGHDEGLQSLLGEVLDAALEITGRERGVIRLVDEAGGALVELATRGFGPEFMQSMTRITRDSEVPSAVAWRTGTRFMVADIAADPVFAASSAGRRLLRHGVRAVQATPLVSRAGQVVGTLTTHGNAPQAWSERELRLLDMLSRDAADFIERAKALAQLQEADRRKDEFLAILAHELRNPLAPIRYAIAIAREPGSSETQRRRADDVIDRQVSHMSRLLDDLLDVSRIARGTVQLRRQQVSLDGIVQAAIEAARPFLEAKSHELVVSDAGGVVVDVDPVRITQVLTNLLNNAAKYTEPRGHISLHIAVAGDDLELAVEDDGIGVADDVRPRLFTLFAQAPGAVQRAEGGLGIGLALVKGFVEMHGGTVSASSGRAGRGTRFIVRLPQVVSRRADAKSASAQGGARRGSLRVLVADDNADICETLAMLLRLWDHEPLTASNGTQALEMLLSERPDVAILDLGMPRMNGNEVARAARARLGRDIVLIAATGWGQEEARAQTAASGFDHHLTKPVDAGVLERILGDVAAARAGALVAEA